MKRRRLFVTAAVSLVLPLVASCSGGKSQGGGTSGAGGSTSFGVTSSVGGATAAGTTDSTSTNTTGASGATNTTSASSTTSTNGGSVGGASTTDGSAGGTTSGGGASSVGGASSTDGTAGSGGLPPLTVNGNQLEDPNGKNIILRGSSLIDIGSLYAYDGEDWSAIANRMDKVQAAGVQGHVVRMPVYPEVTYNGDFPTCSPVPYPVGSGPGTSCTPTPSLSAADYVSQILQPAVDYATSQGLYVIIDFHQIDNATTGNSAADATTFWTDIAPKFASYSNVFYEPFNEPIDNTTNWAALKPVVQGFIDTIRASAPDNIIIVPSNNWDQYPGDAASDPPNGSNLVYAAHIYPNNWAQGFQNQVTTAVAKAPVFVSEWGYSDTDDNPHAWGTSLQSFVDDSGASWTAWVTDNAWAPRMFSDQGLTRLTDFGTLVKDWLAATADSDWVE